MKQIKIGDKEYNCSNRIYYHIQGLESENRVISMELLGHENNELQQQKEIERLNKCIDTALETIIKDWNDKCTIPIHAVVDTGDDIRVKLYYHLFFKGVDKDEN